MSDEVEKVSGFAKNIYSIIILVAFVVGLGITWGTFTSNVSALKEKVNKLEGQVFQLELTKASNEVVLKNIDEKLKDIKESVDELKGRQ